MVVNPRQTDADNGTRRPYERDALIVRAFNAHDDDYGMRPESVACELFDALFRLRCCWYVCYPLSVHRIRIHTSSLKSMNAAAPNFMQMSLLGSLFGVRYRLRVAESRKPQIYLSMAMIL